MEPATRARLSRMIEKIEKNKNFADKIGTKNKSKLEAKSRGEEYKC